jgi:hypothetical protein
MKRLWYLGMLLGLGLGIGTVSAQERTTRVIPTPAEQVMVIEQVPQGVILQGQAPAGVLVEEVGPDGMPPPEAPDAPPKVGYVRKCLNKFGIGCWSHHNNVGCGSLKAECTFIFSSCRVFYGEPCFNGPPPDPAKPAGPDLGRSGCGCR